MNIKRIKNISEKFGTGTQYTEAEEMKGMFVRKAVKKMEKEKF